MPALRTASVSAAALLALAVPTLSGCSGSSGSTTTTTAAHTTTTAGSPSSTTADQLPATGSVDGYTLSVTVSPRAGNVGHTTITVTAVLKGNVRPGHLRFQVSDAPAAGTGKPATSQSVSVGGTGTYSLPSPYTPAKAGSWATTVTYAPDQANVSKLSVSGTPPVAGEDPPFPQLVTLVSA